jgi:hypothetical protein
MEVLKGPLGSHTNYIAHIALSNCADYFHLVKANEEQGRDKTPDKYKQLRYFLNAIESLNNILEYFFHEYKADYNWSDRDMRSILGKMRNKNHIFRDVEQITNGYKHCVRHDRSHLQAEDMQSQSLTVSIGPKGVDVEFSFESIEDEELMGEAFRFWSGYLNTPNKDLLLPNANT